MIVTLTGAFRNVGDHLIGHRARALLAKYVDDDIINITRTEITEADYETMNRARAVILCGGPAYQKHIYPNIYPLDYARITVPIIPMGLGWKSDLKDTVDRFQFAPKAKDFIDHIHKGFEYSSVRDVLTEQVILKTGNQNILMTGCPAWYDLDYMDKSFIYSDHIDQINFSMPARYHAEIPKLLKNLQSRYPNAKKYITFHHGFLAHFNMNGLYQSYQFLKMALAGLRYGFRSVDLSTDIAKLAIYDAPNALHIGYRVHAHLYCLSHKRPSFLINEDVRGVGQAQSLNMPILNAKTKSLLDDVETILDEYHSGQGAIFDPVWHAMTDRFSVMQQFLSQMRGEKASSNLSRSTAV